MENLQITALVVSSLMLLVAVITVFVGMINAQKINNVNQAISREVLSVKILLESRQDRYLIRALEFISSEDISKFSFIKNEGNDNHKKERDLIYYALNYCEILAVSINKGILDEAVMKRFLCTFLIKQYEETKGFIASQRKHKNVPNTIFADFEKLALRWTDDPLTLSDIK